MFEFVYTLFPMPVWLLMLLAFFAGLGTIFFLIMLDDLLTGKWLVET